MTVNILNKKINHLQRIENKTPKIAVQNNHTIWLF